MNFNKLEGGLNIKFIIISVLTIILIMYGIFNARSILFGPSLEVLSPSPEQEFYDNVITVKGIAKNTTFLSLNERPIFIDTEGVFEEKLLLYSGFNTIILKAKDRFKNETEQIIRVYYKQNNPDN